MISGIWENCEGTIDLASAIAYWGEFGYRVAQEGSLDADETFRLYGHRSPLRSARLRHPQGDYGLVRVMGWEALRNEGLGTAPPLTIGGRWFIQNAGNIQLLHDTYCDMRDAGTELVVNEPVRSFMKPLVESPTAVDRLKSVRELMVLSLDHRHAFFGRFNYDRPGYGTIDWESPLKTSGGTHSTIIVGDGSLSSFYADVLDVPHVSSGGGRAGDDAGNDSVLMVKPGEGWGTHRHVAPHVAVGMLVVQWPTHPMPNLQDRSRPGSRGLCLFTYAVDDIQRYHQRVVGSSATEVSEIVPNEFGEPSFSFIAPDGTFWSLLQRLDQ